MSGGLVRFVRRRASFEGDKSVEELQALEFRTREGKPDFRPSVYELDDVAKQLVQACAEHYFRLDPKRGASALDAKEAALHVEANEGTAPFAFVRDAHREVVLEGIEELHAFIDRLRDGAPWHEVTKQQVHGYVRSKLQAGDPEWLAQAKREEARSWLRKLAASMRAEP